MKVGIKYINIFFKRTLLTEEELMDNHISILGICCSRDIFGFQPDNGGYIIDRFVQSVNPIALQMGSMLKDKDKALPESVLKGKSNFYKRNISLDLTKNVFSYLAEVKSDWLVIDAGAFRKNIFFTEDFTKASTLIFSDTARLLKDNDSIYDYKRGGGNIFDLPNDLVSEKIDEFVKNILTLYPQERIVLVEYYDILLYFDNKINSIQDGLTASYISRENKMMRFGFYELKKRLEKAHVIYFPENVLGDVNHKWKKAPLHYIKEYYQYAFEALNVIFNKKLDADSESYELLKLKQKTYHLINEKYSALIIDYYIRNEEEYKTLLKYKEFEGYYKGLLCDGENKIYMKNGGNETGFTGVVKSDKGKWIFVRNGVYDTDFTGVAKSTKGNWIYVKNGCYDTSYTGIAESTKGNKLYIVKGRWQKTYTGKYQSYNIKNGYVI